MELVDIVTAHGRGIWGNAEYAVELRTSTATRWDGGGRRSEVTRTYFLGLPVPPGDRAFPDEAAREAFLAASFSELELTDVERPEPRAAAPWYDGIAVGWLESVTFVADYVQLHWPSGTMNAYRPPLLELPDGMSVAYPDPRYAGLLVGLLGKAVTGVDEFLDLGVVIAVDGTRLVIPLESDGYEILDYNGRVFR